MNIIFNLDGTLFQTKQCDIDAVHYLFDALGLKCNAIKRFRELEHQSVKEIGTLFPDILEMLQQLSSNGHSLYICSNGSMEYIDLVLQCTHIRDYFCEIHSAKLYTSKSEVVKEIIKYNQPTIVIGDTKSDIDAATRNHLPSIAVTYGYGNKDEISEATFMAEAVSDIINYISQAEVFYQVTQHLIYKGKRIIGINGVDTSGKTVFTDTYSKFLDCIGIQNAIIHMDDFHNPSEIRNQGNNEIESYYNHAFNYNQLIDELLNPLHNDGLIKKNILCLNLDTNIYENTLYYDLNDNIVLLIEGVLLFREPMLEYLQGKIFLHIDFDEVIKRAELRDVPKYGLHFLQKYKNKYIPIQKIYLSEHNPEQKSDIVIDNTDYRNPKIISPTMA